MAENVHDVAALILDRLGQMDTWRLQKLAYYSQAWHLAKHGEPLFDSEIQAWSKGPVARDLYERHKGVFGVHSWPAGDARRLGARARETISWVIEKYGGFSGGELSRLSHAEAPWRLTRAGLPDGAPSAAVIDQTLMRDYYRRLLATPDHAVASAAGSARLEGYEFDEAAMSRLREVASGTRSADDAVAEVLARHKKV
jgi:uncharacterized phage-associated protein